MELTYLNNPNSLFRKYSGLITSLTKHQLFRDYVGLPEQVDLLLPNGYHKIREQDKQGKLITAQAIISTRPRFAKKLYRGLYALNLVQSWVQDFEEAQKILLGSLDLLSWGQTPAIARAYRFDVGTFYPDPSPETTTIDGYSGRSGLDESFATLRAGAGNTTDTGNTSSVWTQIKASSTTDQFNTIYRSFFLFDTSSIESGYIISSGVVSLYRDSIVNQLGATGEIDIVSSSPASNTALVQADYSQLGSTPFSSRVIGDLTSDGYYDWNLDSNGISNITKEGISKFGGRVNWDTDGSFGGTWANLQRAALEVRSADTAGTTNDPKLTVTYTPNSASPSLSVSLSVSTSVSPSSSASSSISLSPSVSVSRSPSLSASLSPSVTPSLSISLSPSSSNSPSQSVSSSPSVSVSLSPSVTPSQSISPSPSVSVSRSPSVSVSATQSSSPSVSVSPSPSLSQSATQSNSPSVSPSLSPSPSPSCGYKLYSRGAYTLPPGGYANLDTLYTEAEEVKVETSNDILVDQEGAGQYMIHQFKTFVSSDIACEVTCELRSTLAPTASTVLLQIYSYLENTWVTIDSNNTASADVDFILTAEVLNLDYYKDGSNVITCRVYQLTM